MYSSRFPMSLRIVNHNGIWSRLLKTSLVNDSNRLSSSLLNQNVQRNVNKVGAWNELAAAISANQILKPTSCGADEKAKLFEECLSNTLSLNKKEVRSLYGLCSSQLDDHYRSQESFVKLCTLVKSYYPVDDVFCNPKIFKVPYHVAYNRTKILEELDFVPKYSVSMIDSLHDILNLTPEQIRNVSLHPIGDNTFASICKALKYSEEFSSEIYKFMILNYGNINKVPFSEMRIICFAKLMATQFKSSYSRLHKIIKRYDRNFNETCLSVHLSNVDCLHHQLKVPHNKIFHNGLFIFLENENLIKMSSNLMPKVGAHTFETIVKLPVILKAKFDVIVDNYQLIKSKCDGKFFSRSVELLAYKPSTLKHNFEMIESNPDIQEMNLKVLGMDFLVINLDSILERIKMLKNEDIPLRNVPISFFQVSSNEFKEMLTDFTNDPEMRARNFLEQQFDIDYDHIKPNIRVVSNVKADKYNAPNARRIIEFLIAENVTKEKIMECIYLIFFDYRIVRQAYSNAGACFNKIDPRFYDHLFELIQNTK